MWTTGYSSRHISSEIFEISFARARDCMDCLILSSNHEVCLSRFNCKIMLITPITPKTPKAQITSISLAEKISFIFV